MGSTLHCDGVHCRESCLACSAPLNACLSLPIRNSLEGHDTGKNGSMRILPQKAGLVEMRLTKRVFRCFPRKKNNELMFVKSLCVKILKQPNSF